MYDVISDDGVKKTLHRNLLLPIVSDDYEEDEDDIPCIELVEPEPNGSTNSEPVVTDGETNTTANRPQEFEVIIEDDQNNEEPVVELSEPEMVDENLDLHLDVDEDNMDEDVDHDDVDELEDSPTEDDITDSDNHEENPTSDTDDQRMERRYPTRHRKAPDRYGF